MADDIIEVTEDLPFRGDIHRIRKRYIIQVTILDRKSEVVPARRSQRFSVSSRCKCTLGIKAESLQGGPDRTPSGRLARWQNIEEGPTLGYLEIAPRDDKGERVRVTATIHRSECEFHQELDSFPAIKLSKRPVMRNDPNATLYRGLRRGHGNFAELSVMVYPHDMRQKVLEIPDIIGFVFSKDPHDWFVSGPCSSFCSFVNEVSSIFHAPSENEKIQAGDFLKKGILTPHTIYESVTHFIEEESPSNRVLFEKRKYVRLFPLIGVLGRVEFPLAKLVIAPINLPGKTKFWLNKLMPVPYLAIYGQLDLQIEPTIWTGEIDPMNDNEWLNGKGSIRIPDVESPEMQVEKKETKGVVVTGSLNLRTGVRNRSTLLSYDLSALYSIERVWSNLQERNRGNRRIGIKGWRGGFKWILTVKTVFGFGITIKWGEKYRDHAEKRQ